MAVAYGPWLSSGKGCRIGSVSRASRLPLSRHRALATQAGGPTTLDPGSTNYRKYVAPLSHAGRDASSGTGFKDVEGDDLMLYPDFLSGTEQDCLARAALHKLDRVLGTVRRKRRKVLSPAATAENRGEPSRETTQDAIVRGIVRPDSHYDFVQGHADRVIHDYRESLISEWPMDQEPWQGLDAVLEKCYDLLRDVQGREITGSSGRPNNLLPQTHILHLATQGRIDPHVDHIGYSGGLIMGISLLARTVMRFERRAKGVEEAPDQQRTPSEGFDLLLEPGSVYIQRAGIRYGFEHSILDRPTWQGVEIARGQRISIMFRDKPTKQDARTVSIKNDVKTISLDRPDGTRAKTSAGPLGARAFSTSARCRGHENPLGLPRMPPKQSRFSAEQHAKAPAVPRLRPGGSMPGPPQKRDIPNVKTVIAVASGKGGVGKSTVSVNLALAMAKETDKTSGRRIRVGLLDLDIFGPSVPLMMGLENYNGAEDVQLTEEGRLVPIQNHGIECMSIGFLIPSSKSGQSGEGENAIVWRGLMVMKAVQQLLFEVAWGHQDQRSLDILVVDMPPGTGDVALSLCQLVNLSGAVIVSTPQKVALIDARKGVGMFKKVNVPILGLVSNLSTFVCDGDGCRKRHSLFGPFDGALEAARSMSIPVLGDIPLEPDIGLGGDFGKPIVLTQPALPSSQSFSEVARKILQTLAISMGP